MERTNVRYITSDQIPEPLDLAVMDLSFISVKLILPAVWPLLKDNAAVVCLIKPQFEAGREEVGKKGVVRDPKVHLEVLESFLDFVPGAGFTVMGLDYSPIKGPEGNIEYLGYLRKGTHPAPGAGSGSRCGTVARCAGPWKREQRMKHIVIAANPYRDSGLQKALTVYRMLTEHGHQVVVSPVFAPKSYLPEDIPVQPLEQAAQDAGLIIVMGGDGTILHVAVTLRDHPIPIIGVNFGGKGFLAGLEDDELDILLEIADGKYTISRRHDARCGARAQ